MTSQMMERKVVRYEAQVGAPAEAIFPLLCPVREYEWIDGWSCRMIHLQSGVAEKDAVFLRFLVLPDAEVARIRTLSRGGPSARPLAAG